MLNSPDPVSAAVPANVLGHVVAAPALPEQKSSLGFSFGLHSSIYCKMQ